MSALSLAPRRAAHALIRFYQLTLSGLIGRQCRYLPTCSAYADEAIERHGLWARGWIGLGASAALTRGTALSSIRRRSPSPRGRFRCDETGAAPGCGLMAFSQRRVL